MSRISEKVAYLDGLMDGMEIKDEKYAKLFNAIIDALDVIAEEISDHEDILEDHDDSIDEIFDTLDEHEEIELYWKDKNRFMFDLADDAHACGKKQVPAIALAMVKLYENSFNYPSCGG